MYRLKIKELREKRKLTQVQLEELSNVSHNYISEVERGLHDTSIEVLVKLCIALKVSPNELLDWDNIIANHQGGI